MMINIEKPESILQIAMAAVTTTKQKYYKNGIELEKGAVITTKRIEEHRKLYEKICWFWSQYPDLFLDLIKPSSSHFNLFFYQRLFLRVIVRHGRVCVIAPRAFSKSFISILAMFLMCVFRPGIKVFICANSWIAPCYREVA